MITDARATRRVELPVRPRLLPHPKRPPRRQFGANPAENASVRDRGSVSEIGRPPPPEATRDTLGEHPSRPRDTPSTSRNSCERPAPRTPRGCDRPGRRLRCIPVAEVAPTRPGRRFSPTSWFRVGVCSGTGRPDRTPRERWNRWATLIEQTRRTDFRTRPIFGCLSGSYITDGGNLRGNYSSHSFGVTIRSKGPRSGVGSSTRSRFARPCRSGISRGVCRA
jgi:hypothetical protein